MRRRYQAYTLRENAYGTAYQAPAERVLDISKLDGGLNLWELDYKLKKNQSPETINMYWKDGCLSSRPGQEYLYDSGSSAGYGAFIAGYERLWYGKWICQKSNYIYAVDIETGEHERIYNYNVSPNRGGTFFVFGDNLYYMNGVEYYKITPTFQVSKVDGYIPVVVINRKPDGTGGSLYEDENRISSGKRVRFTSDGVSTDYVLPYQGLSVYEPVTAIVNGVEMMEDEGFEVNRETGVVSFDTAPSQTTPATVNNVEITCHKENPEARTSVLSCKCVTVYGSDKSLSVVCGGTPAQPNAYFWSGHTSLSLDPTYFPFDYYNFAGNADEYITAFGKQQNMLVIFKEHSIGKAYFNTKSVDGMEYLELPYTPVNDTIGCNLEHSVKLVENNLVFANTEGGVYVLLDTSSFGENNVLRISRNVNGDRKTKGLLRDVSSVSSPGVVAFNDGHRYWLSANGNAYIWDYEISSYKTKEENLSWFFFTNIWPVSWLHTEEQNYYGKYRGGLVRFTDTYADFGEPIFRSYTFAVQNFGTYDNLKDVLRVIFAVRSDTNTTLNITYKTDYEERDDLTPIRAWGFRLVPRNLSSRILRVVPYAFSAIRIPRCFHIRHFTMTIYNNELYSDMSIIGAQIVYRYNRRDR